jgi:FlaA1/EpsC-like NDP-sugar epimerase
MLSGGTLRNQTTYVIWMSASSLKSCTKRSTMRCRIRNNSWYYANPTRYVTYFTSLCFVNHITVATIIYITQRSSKYHMQLFNDEALIQITYVVWLRSVPPDNICCLYYEVRLYLYHTILPSSIVR